MSAPGADRLRVHGDRFARAGMLDFAVNVWHAPRPARLREAIAASLESDSYPDESAAHDAIARAHGRPVAEVLALAGACEAFWLLAHALHSSHAVCVHPSFTEGEAALRQTSERVTRVVRCAETWALDSVVMPQDADLVLVTNPNNPTGTLDPPEQVAALARPGRILVVDESFVDFVAGGGSSLAARREIPGLVVVRSLTKAWGLAGFRAGYLLGPAEVVERMAANRQPWSVSAPALAAIAQCVADDRTPLRLAVEVESARKDLCDRLARIPGVKLWPSAANFVLIEAPGRGRTLVDALARGGIAVRPCESFPGLGADHIRLAVRSPAEHETLTGAIARALSARAGAPGDDARGGGAPVGAYARAPAGLADERRGLAGEHV